MKYPRMYNKDEMQMLKRFLPFYEVWIDDCFDEYNENNIFLVSEEKDEDKKDVVIAYGSGEIGESKDGFVLGEMDSFDLYFEEGFTKIREEGFSNMPVKYCLLAETIQEIGEKAFADCGELEKIILPNGLKYIREGAFESCESLKEIHLPSTVEVVEEDAFYGCAEGIRIIIDKPKGSLEGAPWHADDALIVWEESDGIYITDDGEELYRFFADVKEYTIPDGIKRTCYQAFSESGIEKITIPDSVEKLGSLAFELTPLKEINFGKGLKELEPWTFYFCKDLKKVEIPYGIEELRDTFVGCHSLESVVIPESVKKLCGDVFSGCYTLKELYIPENVEEMEGKCFKFFSYPKYKGHTKTTRPEYESKIERLEVDPNNKYFVSENGVIYSKDKSRLVCATTIDSKTFTVPDCVKTIDEYAFCANLNWEKVIIPDGVKINGSNGNLGSLFEGCTIDYVEIPAALCDAKETVFAKCNIKRLVVRGKAKSEDNFKWIEYFCNIEEVIFE